MTTKSPPRRTRPAKDLHAAVVPHLTVAERAARGKAARAEVARSAHATAYAWVPWGADAELEALAIRSPFIGRGCAVRRT